MICLFLHLFLKWASRTGLPREITTPRSKSASRFYSYFHPGGRKVGIGASTPLILPWKACIPGLAAQLQGPIHWVWGLLHLRGIWGPSVRIISVNSKERWIVFCWSRPLTTQYVLVTVHPNSAFTFCLGAQQPGRGRGRQGWKSWVRASVSRTAQLLQVWSEGVEQAGGQASKEPVASAPTSWTHLENGEGVTMGSPCWKDI